VQFPLHAELLLGIEIDLHIVAIAKTAISWLCVQQDNTNHIPEVSNFNPKQTIIKSSQSTGLHLENSYLIKIRKISILLYAQL
jgi:hypothetical protein